MNAQLKSGGPDWWLGISWDRLADGAKEYSGSYASAILTGLEKLSMLWSDTMMKSVDLMVKGTPVRFAVGILAMQGKAFSAVQRGAGDEKLCRGDDPGNGRDAGNEWTQRRAIIYRDAKADRPTGEGATGALAGENISVADY
ncbi:Uncharacterised protein [Enterobacter asburiae]|uniref:Uncharacterized protein n=1 Tax=Enterobacter asburiae TaxID=61645 RepID=A0A376FEG1_ENTAS|nr:Uncharacterised protein [Enterobacter asburiae]